MSAPFAGFCIRGLFSIWLSRAMETLAGEINAKWPGSMQVTDHGTFPINFGYVPWITAQCVAIHKAGKKIVLIGHSFGGTSAIAVAQNLAALKIPVALLCPLDPAAQYSTVVMPNAQRVVGFYQTTPGQLGQGVDAEGTGWTAAEWKARTVDWHRNETHLQIADDPWVHQTIIREITKMVDNLAGQA